MMEKINQYKKQITLAGFVVGALGFVNILPKELPILGNLTDFFYMGIILLSAYTFWTYYANVPPVQRPIKPRPRPLPRMNSQLARGRPIKKKGQTKPETKKIFEEFHRD